MFNYSDIEAHGRERLTEMQREARQHHVRRKHNMDPISIYKMGQLRQQEILEWAAKEHGGIPVRYYISKVGSLLVRVGQKLVEVANPALSAQTTAPRTSVENC